MYSNGASEVIVGKALKKYDIPREKVVIMTKCFWGVGEEPELMHFMHRPEVEASKDYVNQHGLSRAAIFNQVEASLKRLDTPYIDLLQIHRFDYDTPIEETMKALHDLVEQGKVRYIGASSMWYVQTPTLDSRLLSRSPTPNCITTPWLTKFPPFHPQGRKLRPHAVCRREERLDQVCLHAEPLLPALPRGGARDEPLL